MFVTKNNRFLLQKIKLNILSKFSFSSLPLSRKLPLEDKKLKERDEELWNFIECEKLRQWEGIELIASENYTSTSVLECLGSVLTNKYSEGYPNARYYGGNEFIDKIENLAIERALKAFRLNSNDWGVNVQPLSGSPANFAAYTGLIKPGDKIMGLHLYHGGHLTHGFQTEDKKISATSLYFESKSYQLDDNGRIDMKEVEKVANEFKPKILIVGASAYPRDFEYESFRKIADNINAYLLADISHISGLIAAQEQNNAFDYCDIVTTTTHKTLRGPRAGMIFFNKKKDPTFEERINFAVFPMLQGGPHEHQIAGIATQMKEVATEEFKIYARQIKSNAKELANSLINKGYKLISDGTDNHLMLLDVRPNDLTGSKVEKVCDMVHITVNKNTIVGDKSAITPGGIRIGTPAVTTRGFKEEDMKVVASFLDRVIKICVESQKKSGKNLSKFLSTVKQDPNIEILSKEVKEFSRQFYIPGVDIKNMKYYNH